MHIVLDYPSATRGRVPTAVTRTVWGSLYLLCQITHHLPLQGEGICAYGCYSKMYLGGVLHVLTVLDYLHLLQGEGICEPSVTT